MFFLLHRLLDRLSRLPRTARRSAVRRDRRIALFLEALEHRLSPATDVWTGAGAGASLAHPSPNWSNPLNWQSDVAPQPGDTLIFPAAPIAKTRLANNDYAAGTVFNSIQIAGDGFLIQGNAVQLADGVTNSAGFNTVALDITLAAAQSFTESSGTLVLAGSLNNGGHLLTVATSDNVLYTGKSITGSGGLTVEGNGFSGKFFLQDSTPDRYTGVTTVLSAGVLYLDGAESNAIVGNLVAGDGPGPNQSDCVHLALNNQIANTASVTVYADGLFDLDGFNDTIGSLTMSGGYVTTGTGTLTLAANVTTQAASMTAEIDGNLFLGTGPSPKTFTVASGSAGTDLHIAAAISGGAGAELLKAGAGDMRLDGNNSYAGSTVVSAGTLTAASADALGAGRVSIAPGATLEYATSGSSTLSIDGNLSNAGAVDIDGAGTVGTVTVNGNYSQTAGASLQMALASPSAFDQLAISGSAALAGTLNVGLQNGFRPVGGNQFKIMTFGSSSGAFSTVDLPMARVLALQYDPRDLTLVDTAAPPGNPGGPSVPPGADVWTGAGASASWSNPLNWAAHVAPKVGDSLYFPAAPTATVSVNNYASGTTFASLTIAGTGYQITGNAVQLQNGLTAENTAGVNTVALPLSFSAAATITDANLGATLVLAGSVANGGNLLTVNTDGNVVFKGPALTGSGGLAVAGTGTFTLADTAADTFTGPTEVQGGTLIIASAGALSTTTTVDTGATLELEGGVTVSAADSLNLNGFGAGGAGALQAVSGSDTWNGTIGLASSTAIGTSTGTTLTIGASPSAAELTKGVITGPYTSNLSYVGNGTAVLAGPDSYLGYTTVASGILALDNLNALTGAPYYGGRGTGVDAGATLQLWAAGTYALDPLALSGAGAGGIGAVENMAGNNTWQGPLKLNGNTTLASAAGSSLTTNAEIGNEGYLLTVNAVGNVDFNNTLGGAGGLTKNGPGTLTLSGPSPNVYAGPTIVNAGTILLTKHAGIPALSGAGVTINLGATLAGSGSINANVFNAGVVSPGGPGSIGTLVINGTYTQTATGILDMEVASTAAIDQVMICGLATLDGTLDVTFLNGFQPAAGNLFPLLTFGSSSGRFRTVNLPSTNKGVELSVNYDANDLTLAAVAAPSA